ncbi:MAG: carbohydrate ABC transporter substrate-binding protein, partial [Firmicutes bacterium]|nr:carbohydrate ABC transporter substrate-binding protein [Bacillota bacterium]
TVNWIINPSDNGVYQQKLDEALLNQENAAADEKIDMFLAEADYIGKYVDSDYTMDISQIGFQNAPTMYDYTIKAASDQNGVCKGVSFQCCPAAVIYRKSIAKDVLGTDVPDEVQAALDSWEKFDAVAAEAKAKGYYMTASFAETFRAFSNNCTSPWVDANNNLQFDDQINAWIEQTEKYVENGYTLATAGVWDQEKTDQMFKTGKTMCFFGPAWYYNFCMTNAMDPDNGCVGDWCIIQGPQTYFWGGTWLLAATGSDNTEMLKDIFETFTVNEDVCTKLVENENQYPNNTAVVEKFANDPNYGNTAILDGQNDIAAFSKLAGNIKWENHTNYDQILNEGLQNKLQEYFKGSVTKEEAMQNFYQLIRETYPAIKLP